MNLKIILLLIIILFSMNVSAEWVYLGNGLWFDNEAFVGCYESIETCPPESAYTECLVKITDTVHSKIDRRLWTAEMIEEERAANTKQGYIVTCKDSPAQWGRREAYPDFVVVRINKSDYNSIWLEPEYNQNYLSCANSCEISHQLSLDFDIIECDIQCERTYGNKIVTKRKYRIPMENIFTTQELMDLTNIQPSNNITHTSLVKNITDMANKVSLVDWEKRPSDFILHSSSGTFSICPSGCDYTSVAGFEAGEAADLTGSGPSIGNITESFGESSSSFQILGWTTTASDYLKIMTDENANSQSRHSGVWSNDSFRWVEDGDSIRISEDFVWFDGLQLNATSLSTSLIRADNFAAGGEFKLSNSICTSSATERSCIYAGVAGATFKYWNNIIFDSGDFGAYLRAGTHYFYSNTIVNSTDDGVFLRDGTYIVNNTLATGTMGNNFDLLCFAGTCYISYSASQDGSMDDEGGDGNRVNQYFDFEDSSSNNYHLTASDTGAKDYGIDLSSDGELAFSDDIDGESRAGTWDIGADEYILLGDSTDPIINGTLNKSISTIYQYDIINATFNMTDESGSINGTIVINESGFNQYYNFSFIDYVSGTQQISQNFSVSGGSGTVINVTGIATDNASNTAQNETIFTVTTLALDTCSCPASGEWNIDCSDNCYITTSCNMQGNDISIYGAGTFETIAEIYNYGSLNVNDNNCDLVIN